MNGKMLGLLVLCGSTSVAQASLITADFSVNITQVYNAYTQSYEAISPLIATGSFDVNDAASFAVTRNGNTTTTAVVTDPDNFSPDLRYASPLPANLPGSNSGDFIVGGPFTDYGFTAYTSDLTSGFIEGLQFYVNFVGPAFDHGVPSDTYFFNVSITRQSAPRHGDGSSGYEFTGDKLVDFLQSVKQDGGAVQYHESYSTAASIGDFPYPVGTAGLAYADDMARIVSVAVDGVSSAIPEPATAGLALVALAAATLATRRRNWRP